MKIADLPPQIKEEALKEQWKHKGIQDESQELIGAFTWNKSKLGQVIWSKVYLGDYNAFYTSNRTKIYTIEDLSKGRVAIKAKGDVNKLKAVMKAAFPNDNLDFVFTKYYTASPFEGEWERVDKTDLPKQSIKKFYKQLKNSQ